jgi:FkbH-like protein
MTHMEAARRRRDAPPEGGLIKCVVWDLDDTIWDGTLLEDPSVTLRTGITELLDALDRRGILHSIASRNHHGTAAAKLRELEIDHFFLHPQINWNAKSSSVREIARSLNIGLDTLAFVDDQPFERAEVAAALPEVLCVDAAEAASVLDSPRFAPVYVTEDSRQRRAMMIASMAREAAEAEFTGAPVEFLASLGMRVTIGPAGPEDLHRAEELTLRTNQLNTTGYTYSYDELATLSRSPDHLVLIAGLEDRFGTYGRIGLALLTRGPEIWTIRLLLMSCRVMSRGVGSIFLGHIMRAAREAGVRLQAEFIPNDRNRMMLVTYRLAGFRTAADNGTHLLLEHDLAQVPKVPSYVTVLTSPS